MTFSQPTQSPGTPSVVPVLPMLFRLGDDWVIPVALANGVTGDPVDLTGAHVSARLYCPFPIDIAGPNGSVTVTSATEGALTVIVAETATGGVSPQSVLAKLYPCRLSVTVVDTIGHKHTYDPIPILPLKPQDDAPVPTQGQVQILTTYQQGPAGASNSLTAEQIGQLVVDAVAAALAGNSVPVPADTSLPVISGNAVAGQVLLVTSGAWSNSPTSYAYRWNRDGTPIDGANSQGYTVLSADIGHALSCTVTATNAGGSASATSNATAIVAVGLTGPANTVAPTISGIAQSGQLLTATTGTFTGNPTPVVSRQWFSGENAIAGAIGFTYYPVDADVGSSITYVETAVNSQGSVTASSVGTAVIIAAVSLGGAADFSNSNNSGLIAAIAA